MQIEHTFQVDQFGHQYVSLLQLAQLPTDHPYWEAIRRAPKQWRECMPFFDPADCVPLYEDEWRAVFQFAPRTMHLLGYIIGEYRGYDHCDSIVPMLWSRGLFVRYPYDTRCSGRLQQALLTQFMLSELWYHDCVYGEMGINLPDELYPDQYVPDFTQYLDRYERPVPDYILWFDRPSSMTSTYRYCAKRNSFVAYEV